MRECFLSGLNEKQALLHALIVCDLATHTQDTIYVSDDCYRIMCHNNDEVAARMWQAFKQATSAGYNDTGFVSDLKRELAEMRVHLMVGVDPNGYGAFFVAITEPIGPGSGKLCLWCRNRIPLPPRTVAAAEKLVRIFPFSVNAPWIHDRWMVATVPAANGKFEWARPDYMEALYKLSMQDWGDPPDIFAYVANSETLIGYEIIRRALL